MMERLLEKLGIAPQEDEDDGEPYYPGKAPEVNLKEKATRLLLVHAYSVADMESVAKGARSGVGVILSLENADTAECQRILDYCQGLCAGLGLECRQASGSVYLLSAQQVKIVDESSGDGPLSQQEEAK